ncbi:hypothetical protein BO86DRAFT_63478 [Aspergillus japonicus CBS 114.51]|uniref:Uncharacterized protein n=1 Tax=Aspergillus japonicus CBS 114.51 TaxID=1448312 RepID=A0A8T8X4P3_ASPJA|nr:hypothetical protein BO86DRAFT_63478 [Aspergillus japonicus CBS 114.51]RAH82900.1 hypothetical protein BO86DRAFT_63478 [Aspergillus japonicus CBS 114.51]
MASIDTAMTEDAVQVKIWDLRPGTCPCRIIHLPDSIQSDSLFISVAFSPNGETLAFGKADGSIHRIHTDFSKWEKVFSQDDSGSSQDKEAYFQEEKTRSHVPSLEDLFNQDNLRRDYANTSLSALYSPFHPSFFQYGETPLLASNLASSSSTLKRES